jgi:hypothetical protein
MRHEIDKDGDITFYNDDATDKRFDTIGVFDTKENEFTFFYNELSYEDIEFVYKVLKDLEVR